MVKNDSINCGLTFKDSNELKVSNSELRIPQQEMNHRYFLQTDTNGVLLPLRILMNLTLQSFYLKGKQLSTVS